MQGDCLTKKEQEVCNWLMIFHWMFILIVVTVSGVLFHKAGFVTGGLTPSMETRAARWDEKKIDGNNSVQLQ
jgi:hypothetical protein